MARKSKVKVKPTPVIEEVKSIAQEEVIVVQQEETKVETVVTKPVKQPKIAKAEKLFSYTEDKPFQY